MDQIWNQLKTIVEKEDGFIRTSQVEQAGISRPMLKKYMEVRKLERVRKGIYVLSAGLTDEYAPLQVQSAKAIFSYGTALFLWGMSGRNGMN